MAAFEPADPLARGHPRVSRRVHGSRGNGAAAGEIAPPHGLPRMAAAAGTGRVGRDPDPGRSAPAGMPALAASELERLGKKRLRKARSLRCHLRLARAERDSGGAGPALQPVRGSPPIRRDPRGRAVKTPRSSPEITLVGAGLA